LILYIHGGKIPLCEKVKSKIFESLYYYVHEYIGNLEYILDPKKLPLIPLEIDCNQSKSTK